MRIFWAIIAVLAILTAVLLMREGSRAPKPVALDETPIAAEAAPVAPAPVSEQVATEVAAPIEAPKMVTPEDVATAIAPKDVKPEQAPAPDPTPAPAEPVVAKDTIAAIDAPKELPAPVSTPAPVTAEPAAAGAVTSVPVKLEKQEDGWTRVDDRFMIRGAGTAEDPYVIPWDILVSASETYRPRLGRKIVPDRVTMLNGKHVRVTGFVLFPMLMQETKELLLMRNQWDGCCIGVPPTPYDAVEVKLLETATRADMFVQYATLEGVMKVEPYVNRDWLLGMYILENTKVLKLSDEGVKKPTHVPGQHPGGAAEDVPMDEGSAP